MTPEALAAVEARDREAAKTGAYPDVVESQRDVQPLLANVRRLTAENGRLLAQLGVTAHFLEYVADGMRTEARELDATDKAHLATGMLARAAIWDETRLEIVALLRAMP